MTSPTGDHRRFVPVGPVLVTAMTMVVAVSWAPWLASPLAGNHLGNVSARHGLQVRNLYEQGLVASHFGADWQPYRTEPYAHHPPLLNILHAIVGLLPGDGVVQLRLAPYALALAAIPAGAVLLRTMRVSWPATILATGALAGTGYFWVYGPIGFDLAFVFGLAAVTRRLEGAGDAVPAARSVRVALLAAATALASWPGVVFCWAFVAVLWRRRGADHTSLVVAGGALVGTAVTAVYVVGVSGWSNLVDQAETRSSSGSYDLGRYIEVVGGHVRDLLPLWYLVLLVPAVIAGIADRRTRTFMIVAVVFVAGWVGVLNQGAVVHDYWAYLVVVPGLAGTAVLADRLLDAVAARSLHAQRVAMGLAGALLLGTFVATAWGGTARHYLDEPSDAGRVITETAPPDDQAVAWSVGFEYGRILSYSWRIPTAEITDVDLDELPDGDLIFVDGTELPGWWPAAAPPAPVTQHGDYFLVTAGRLRQALEDDPFEF